MTGRDHAPAGKGALGFLIAHRRLVLSLTAVGMAIGIALAVVAPSTYRSEVDILITRLSTPGDDPVSALEDEARFVNAAVVRDAVRSSIPDAPNRVDVDIEPGRARLHIAASDDDPDKALRLARAWASAYIGERRNVLIERLTEQSEVIDAELTRLVTDIGTARLATDDDEVARLEARRDRLAADQTAIDNDLAALSRAAGAEVVDTATRPDGRSGVALAPAVGLGALLGAGLGATLGLVLDRRRR